MKRQIGLLITVLLLLAFAKPLGAQEEIYFPTTDWRTSTPEEQGIDSAELADMLGSIRNGADDIHSLLVIRNGYVVLDVSTYPFRADQPHYLYSVTKSVISTLVGIAIEQGYIESVNQSIWDFFPQETVPNMDERKAAITIRDLLIQSSGLSLGQAGDGAMYALTADDVSWVQFLLDMPMAFTPGHGVDYLDANVHLLSAIIGEATGMSAAQYADANLFAPLGITGLSWRADPQGVTQGGSGLSLTPYDMAKLGYLYLHNGEWTGRQLLPPTWVRDATSEHNRMTGFGYGYLWWLREAEGRRIYSASGYGGQFISVVPDEDLVVVATGDVEGRLFGPWIVHYILPAIVSDNVLPDNAEAQAALATRIEALASPLSADVPPIPLAIATAAGHLVVLDDNPLGWESLTLIFTEEEASLRVDVAGTPFELPFGLDGSYRLSPAAYPRVQADSLIAGRLGRIGDNWLIIHAWDLSGEECWDIRLRLEDTVTVTVTAQLVSNTVRINGGFE